MISRQEKIFLSFFVVSIEEVKRMLIAETKAGVKLFANDLIERPTEPLICPGCKEPVIFKKGRIKLPHFAHKPHTKCFSFSEGETAEHLMNKSFFHQWSGGQLEAYLPQLKQRPDILVHSLAIEIQCSPLSFERYIERTKNYQKHGYQPWWLLGNKLLPQQRWGQLQKAFCSYTPEKGIHLWGIKAQQKEIWLVYAIRNHFRLGFVYRIKKWCFREESLEALLLYTDQQPTSLKWNFTEYRYHIQRKLFLDDAKIHELQQKIYLLGGNIQTLPGWCYQLSDFYFFFEDRLLFLRYCFTKAVNFDEWLQLLKYLEFTWQYPLILQKEILMLVYQECQRLAE